MQRLYSMFPLGGPGVGLVSLRFAMVLALYVDRSAITTVLPGMLAIPCLVITALSLTLGILTPVFALLGLFVGCVALFQANTGQAWVALLTFLIAIALLLLGPGAYSVDARIYGRRIVTPNWRRD